MSTPTQPPRAERRGCLFRVGLAGLTSVVLLLAAEAVTRLAFPLEPADAQRLQAFRDYAVHRRHRVYDPHPFTGYTPRNWLARFHASFALAKPEGVTRIACLGGSTTEGAEAWPHVLDGLLGRRASEQVEVMNWGVSGWTTTETLVNWLLDVQDWSPDLVLIHHAANDVLARIHPGFRTDYAHFRHPWQELNLSAPERWLLGACDLYARLRMEGVRVNIQSRVGYPLDDPSIALSGQLPPGTSAAYERNLRTMIEDVRATGARAALLTMPYNPAPEFQTGPIFATNHDGTREHNEIARRLAAETGCLLIDLAASFEENRAMTAGYFRDGVHLDPGGHRAKAKLVADALLAAGWVHERE